MDQNSARYTRSKSKYDQAFILIIFNGMADIKDS